jgi:hypothetical protein
MAKQIELEADETYSILAISSYHQSRLQCITNKTHSLDRKATTHAVSRRRFNTALRLTPRILQLVSVC